MSKSVGENNVPKRKGCRPGQLEWEGKCRNANDIVSMCHKCGTEFTVQNMIDASEGKHGSPVGDWDWVCYPCEFEMIEKGTWKEWRDKMLQLHSGSGKCNHVK